MNFSIESYRPHVRELADTLSLAGADRVALIVEGDFHMSFHFDSVTDDWWDVGARGAICYAVLSENQPEELLNGRSPTTLRRSNVVQVNAWVVYFFSDGERVYCNGHLPDCYKTVITKWLASSIRNQASGASVVDDLFAYPVAASEEEWLSEHSGGGHANCTPAMSR